MKKSNFTALKAGAAPLAICLAMVASPAFAQNGVDCDANPDDSACEPAGIIVTGSILRTNVENANPVTTIKADQLETRGVTTVEEAIQNLSANGAGMLPNSFSANGAFAAGASAASLRGLTTSSTLVLFDGMRAAYYPLADDGTRNFVDLNTIPDAIVDRVEVLKDGASSTYGADAIAGVINIITKKQVTGLHLGGEYGTGENGLGETYNLEATYGFGDLDQQGFNVYVSGSYYNSELIKNSQLDAPFNSSRGSGFCNADGTDCLDNFFGAYHGGREFNGDWSGFAYLSLNPVYISRPYTAPGTAAGGYEILNQSEGCRGGPQTNLTAAEQGGLWSGEFFCTYDLYGDYGVVTPDQERINTSMRATVALSDDIEAFVAVNYARSDVSYNYYGASIIRGSAPAETGVTFNLNPLYLPVYVCDGATYNTTTGAAWDNGCNAGNGTLNPNNPYAAAGQLARVGGAINELPESSRYKTDAFRGSFGVEGTFADDYFFKVGGTAMKVELQRTLDGRVHIGNFLQTVADGSYNFMDPSANSAALLSFIAPTIDNRSTSEMYQLDAQVSRDLFELPGGPLQLGLGASVRHERVDAPGADSDGTSDPSLVNRFDRYTSRVNPFGSKGSRTVYSAYGEADAPITDWLNLNLGGRYDDYSTGQSNFSPKVGVRLTPIPQLMFRGTFSRGFRIGSFAEFGASPTTGYITGTGTIPQALQDAYQAANGGVASPYVTSYSLGLTQVGNTNLKPEKSSAITLGFVAEPIPGVSFTVDYYEIKKTDLITGADYLPALAAYYAGQPIPDGFVITPDVPDTNPASAGLLPRVQFVQYSFTNKDEGKARGIDFAASVELPITSGITFRSSAEASYLLELSQTTATGTQEYAGSIGPYVITSAAGSPEWRGSWQNTLDFGRGYVSLTAYYTDGYSTSAEDISGPGTRFDCDESLAAHYYLSGDTYQCSVDSFTYFNLAAGFDVNDSVNVYMNVNNLFAAKAPIDTATYGGYGYNPAWAGAGVMGRYFKLGVKAAF